eukprot:Skav217054  [mRNA]  locus=scaffold208:10364:11932:+ [translate_table: standard]
MEDGQGPVEPSFEEEQQTASGEDHGQNAEGTVQRNSIRFNKMTNMRHMEIDEEFTRGIALHRALRHPELWTSPQEIRRKNQATKVWNLSEKVSRFDTFLSHTWRTKGRWKILALMIQTGWLHGMLAWSIGLAMMLCLRRFDIVTDPWTAIIVAGGQALSTPLSPWTIVVSELALLIGLYFSPYLPLRTQMCFFDAACIHQGESEMFERGIYGIGGCLSVAQELRVLYTSKYLSSLWCVFEIAGFRKVKPKGKLTFSPLFVERSTVICSLIMFYAASSINFVLVFIDVEFRERYTLMLHVTVLLLPMIFVVHTMRLNYRKKSWLMFDLKTFNVDKLICASDFDRDFILSAIEAWYGSREAFNAFVQNDLREELLSLLPSPHLPCSYATLILSSQVAWVLDWCVSVQKAGFHGQVLLRSWISSLVFFIFWYWFAFNGIFYLSDRAAPFGPNWLLDWCKTLAVAGVMFSFTLTGFALWVQVCQTDGLVNFVCFTAFSLLLPCLILNPFQICRPRERTSKDAVGKS